MCCCWREKVVRLIFELRRIVSSFWRIKEMLMVNGVMASVFEMGQGFQVM
jgi:hypothetical protein